MTPEVISFVSEYKIHIPTKVQNDTEMFQFTKDSSFDFEYKSGQNVVYNSTAM